MQAVVAGAGERRAAAVTAFVSATARLMALTDPGSSVLCRTPSYALHVAEAVEEAGIAAQLKLRVGFFGAEPWTEGMRDALG